MNENHARILRSLIAVLLMLITVTVILAVFFTPPVSHLPQIAPEPSLLESPPVIVTHTFPYKGADVTVTVPVNISVAAGAARVERRGVNLHETTDIDGRIYRAMIDDPAQEPLYGEILTRLRTVRAERDLSDDKYLELVTTYVQSLRYAVSDTPPRYPVETVMARGGDCDDKSLLLAGLLAREDYSVALFLFRPEEHMAVGVGSDGPYYKSAGYTYIEVTGPAKPGIPPGALRENVTLLSDPEVIPVSTGTKRYLADGQGSPLPLFRQEPAAYQKKL